MSKEDEEIIDEELYNHIIMRDDTLCQVCGCLGDEIHHIIYKSHGGKNNRYNLILLCRNCHNGPKGVHGTREIFNKKDPAETLLKIVKKNELRLKERQQ